MARINKEDLRIEKTKVPYLTAINRGVTPTHIVVAIGHEKSKYSYRGWLITACGRYILHGWAVRYINEGDNLCKRCGDLDRFQSVLRGNEEYIANCERKTTIERSAETARRQVDQVWNETGASIERGITDDVQSLVDAGKTLVPFTKKEVARMRFLIERRLVLLGKRESDAIDQNETDDLTQMQEVLVYDD